MELLRKTLDTDQSVDLVTFAAGEHTILKEVIMDRHRGVRTYFRLYLTAKELGQLSLPELLRKTRSFGKLSELCAYLGIDPARAAVGKSTPHSGSPVPDRMRREANGRFATTHTTQRHG